MKHFKAIIILLVLILLSGCAVSATKGMSPMEIVSKYFQELSSKNINGMSELKYEPEPDYDLSKLEYVRLTRCTEDEKERVYNDYFELPGKHFYESADVSVHLRSGIRTATAGIFVRMGRTMGDLLW